MTTNELREGNLVLVNGKIVEVEDIFGAMGINEYRPGCTYDLYELKPIELTNKILLKLGFYKDHDDNHISEGKNSEVPVIYCHDKCYTELGLYKNNEVCLISVFKPYEYAEPSSYSWDFHKISKPLKYVHQLQNLIFSLNQEEITLK